MGIAIPATAQSPDPYAEAVEARRAANPARAASILEQVLKADPANSDALVQYGYSLLALRRLDDAEAAFRQALAVAPNYQDARDGLELVTQRRKAAPAPAATRFKLDLDGGLTSVSQGQPDWRDASVQLRYDQNSAVVLTGRVELARRFRRTDVYGEARVDFRQGNDLSGYLLTGGTPDADFRPKVQLGMGGSAKIGGTSNPTIATLDARWADYASGEVWTLNPGVQQYLGGGRVWLTAQWINIFQGSDHSSGWLARADYLPTPKLRLFGGVANAPDISEGVVLRTSSQFGGLALGITDNQDVRLSVAHDDPDGSAKRTSISIGTGIRF
ncbi:YaiO family outer membrane beta-barrel protein [Sphingomonas edaphi]|uniref:YaiO family outer membrane beta-barrel protein n=1 Tax=Sphingomonas edaphi TaxID=2315689 RepID=UPI0011C3C37D|nr:YaiO family outer membrane beta-barrel protein [Sphingomonas edaphi]